MVLAPVYVHVTTEENGGEVLISVIKGLQE